jgi:DNA-binding MarR family transcriptional regulator
LEKFAISGQEPPINANHVAFAISMQQIMADMELELIEIFKEPTQRRQAVELLSQLRGNPMNQKEIAEYLNVSEATAGKVVNKLFAYRYINRQRGEGKAFVISLKV